MKDIKKITPTKAVKPTLWGDLPINVRQDPMLRAKLNSLVSIPPYAVPLGSIPSAKQAQLVIVDATEDLK
tara:strand:- start:2662 stop:2871 length:210 start_codon:yes stop_codon:yes gene_type:complete